MAKYIQLSLSERCQIITALVKKQSINEIATKLSRHRSTIYRELKRNKQNNSYDPLKASHFTKERRAGGANSLFVTQPLLKEYVIANLKQSWSPEAISGRMKYEKQLFSVCTETIYQFIYRDPAKELYKFLPSKRKKRMHRHRRKQYISTKSKIIATHNIKNRPIEVLDRKEIGHWEGDTIRFQKSQKHNVTTLVERVSRLTMMQKNLNGKTKNVISGIYNIIKKQPKEVWKTLTFDQGMEFRDFAKIESSTTCRTFFCDPRSPWQRPTNENTNGRIRYFLPKNLSIDNISNTDLEAICHRMNNTPRKCLGYQTPQEVFMQRTCRTSF